MRAVAIKKSSREKTAGFREMGTLRCDGCGEDFFIGHDPASMDKLAAEKQAKWLEKVLAEEHERDKKHPDRIELPEQATEVENLTLANEQILKPGKGRLFGAPSQLDTDYGDMEMSASSTSLSGPIEQFPRVGRRRAPFNPLRHLQRQPRVVHPLIAVVVFVVIAWLDA